MKRFSVLYAIGLGLAASSLQAQSGSSPELAPTANDSCRTAVSKFEQTIFLIRQTQGNEAAAKLKEHLLPTKLESDILFKEGYCGLARYLQEKKLDR